MKTFFKHLIFITSIFYFSCENDVTGGGSLCTADPVGEWSGITRTIVYEEDCGTHCPEYDSSYIDHYQHTICSDWLDQVNCERFPFDAYLDLVCYDYLEIETTNPFPNWYYTAKPSQILDCDSFIFEDDCNDNTPVCKWLGNLGCQNYCNEEVSVGELTCEWNDADQTCGEPLSPTDNDRFINLISCLGGTNKNPAANCIWDGESLEDGGGDTGNAPGDADGNGILFEGGCVWASEYIIENNIETELYTFDEDGNYSFEETSDDQYGDYSCTGSSIELCYEGNCIIWPFSPSNDVVTNTIEYFDEYTEFKEECTATQTFIIQKNIDE